MGKKILIVVDMQNDFIDGALGSKEAEQMVERCADKAREAQKAGDIVIFTRDTHGADYMKSEEGKNLPVPHCIEGTKGWEIAPAFAGSEAGSVVYNKETFGSRALGEKVAELCASEEIDCAELVGLCTDICVISNALLVKAFCPNLPIYVDASCCAGVTPESHDTAIRAMESCHIHVTHKGEEPWRNA